MYQWIGMKDDQKPLQSLFGSLMPRYVGEADINKSISCKYCVVSKASEGVVFRASVIAEGSAICMLDVMDDPSLGERVSKET